MKILYVASEASPFAVTGGLGDVMGSLPSAVSEKFGKCGDVRLVVPLYPSVRQRFGDSLTSVWEGETDLAWRRQYVGIRTLSINGVTCYFIDNEYYFKRESMYGDMDDGERFAFFSSAVLRLLSAVDFFPDVIHANDWQSALVPVYLRLWYGSDPRYSRIRTVYTIHNASYQGVYSPETLWDVFGIEEGFRHVSEYGGAVNLSKAAIVCADRVTTVSPTYARELLTEHYSHGLCHVLRMRRDGVRGILNGIDTHRYDPATDPHICKNYSAEDPSGKASCKAELCSEYGFDSTLPVVGMVSRLATHKGFDLVRAVIEEMLSAGDTCFILLGTGERRFEEFFSRLAEKYPGRFCCRIDFDSAAASRIYAGADLFLMPSESEPCGLAQMIAMRYGTIPIVRETGGLADSVPPLRDDVDEGLGFTFTNYNAHDMMYTIRRGLGVLRQKDRFLRLQKRCMTEDFSWGRSAEKYIEMYRELSCRDSWRKQNNDQEMGDNDNDE